MSIEDLMVRENGINGVVLNWSSVEMSGLHIDPLTIRSKAVIDATGHPLEIIKIVQDKMEAPLNTETGKIMGEKSMWADRAEGKILDNVNEVYKEINVKKKKKNTEQRTQRMGPIFGGMLLSGEYVAKKVAEDLENRK
jgi:thiamine thiazole synthase